MNNGVSVTKPHPQLHATAESAVTVDFIWWNNPYLLGCLAISVTAITTLLCSLLVFNRLHHVHQCSLFLVEMAVGSLTAEAIMHLLPALILTEIPSKPSGMPAYFPHLATVTAGVCLLHALDTASAVFFGRRQSTSHAMEWRNENHRSDPLSAVVSAGGGGGVVTAATAAADQGGGGGAGEDDDSTNSEPRVKFSEDSDSQERRSRGGEITLRQVLRDPRLCVRPGPYRLCSIMSAGSVVHSFANGIAIGAAFVKSWESGLHLSLSVATHELAHKVADSAVLTASGFSLSAIVLLNSCYWVATFGGLFVAVPLSQRSDKLRLWIVTVATSVFVYISLVTMSSMVRRNYLPKHIKAFVIGNVGMTVGFILILLANVLGFYF